MCLRACACVRMYYAAGRGGGSRKAAAAAAACSVEVVFGGGGGECDMDSVEGEKNEEMGSLCTCFQGNRGLQNTGRLDFLFSMCCTALWQNTADPSNDSRAPHRWPRCCSAVFDLKLHLSATYTKTRCRCTTIERKPQIGHYGSNVRDRLQVTSLSVPPPHHHHHSSPTSPR